VSGRAGTPLEAPRETSAGLARWIREQVLRMAATGPGAHVGGSLSVADVLAVLYADVLRRCPDGPCPAGGRGCRAGCDLMVLSKGHAAPALYAVLAADGQLDPAELPGYATTGSRLFGHPSAGLPGVAFTTGSLGHGLGLAAGVALSRRLAGAGGRVYVLVGDGELQEGSVWEALMFAAHQRLGNLIAVVDRNGLQINGATEDVVGLEPLAQRLAAFGWAVTAVDGHDHAALRGALAPPPEPVPRAVICRTVKGKGVGFLEGTAAGHYASFSPRQLSRALAHLASGPDAAGPAVARPGSAA
jgi:transketolase